MERIDRPPVSGLASRALRELAESVPEIDHYELDGIPLFHLPAVGATILTLSIGVGMAHEPVPERGITHLLEHLLLTGMGGSLDHTNGATEAFRVTFTTRGSPSDAAQFLRGLCEQIAYPRTGRLHQEVNVLNSEASLRPAGMSLPFRMYWLRTGYQGLGVTQMQEYFLEGPDEPAVRSWLTRHMVAENAAIWVAGPLPDDLYISLEPGAKRAMPGYEEIPGFQTPTLYPGNPDGVGASFRVARGLAIQAALRTLESHLRKALRVDRGLGYIVTTDYRPVSADEALASVYASCLPKAVPEVQRAVLDAIDDLAARGSTEEEIAQQYETAVQDATDPMANASRLDRRAQDLLMGHEPQPSAVNLDRMWRLTPEEVADAFRRARDTMLLMLPRAATKPQRAFKAYPGAPPVVFGKGYTFELSTKPKGGRPFGAKSPPKLFVGSDGVSIDVEKGSRVAAIPWAEAVAVIRRGRARTILARDGNGLTVQPAEWKEGEYASALVDRFAPADLVVPRTTSGRS